MAIQTVNQKQTSLPPRSTTCSLGNDRIAQSDLSASSGLHQGPFTLPAAQLRNSSPRGYSRLLPAACFRFCSIFLNWVSIFIKHPIFAPPHHSFFLLSLHPFPHPFSHALGVVLITDIRFLFCFSFLFPFLFIHFFKPLTGSAGQFQTTLSTILSIFHSLQATTRYPLTHF